MKRATEKEDWVPSLHLWLAAIAGGLGSALTWIAIEVSTRAPITHRGWGAMLADALITASAVMVGMRLTFAAIGIVVRHAQRG